MDEYTLFMKSLQHNILSKRVLYIGNVIVNIGEIVTCINTESEASQTYILYFDKHNEIPITEEYIMTKIRNQSIGAVSYILYDNIYLDSRSLINEETMKVYMYVIDLLSTMKYKTEDFISRVQTDVMDVMAEERPDT